MRSALALLAFLVLALGPGSGHAHAHAPASHSVALPPVPGHLDAAVHGDEDSPAAPARHRCDRRHSACSLHEGHGLIPWVGPVERKSSKPAPALAAVIAAPYAVRPAPGGAAPTIDRFESRRRSGTDLYLLTSRLLI